jgi:hypothetical protein
MPTTQMNYSLNLKEELISETNKAGKKVKKTFLVEGFSPTESSGERQPSP